MGWKKEKRQFVLQIGDLDLSSSFPPSKGGVHGSFSWDTWAGDGSEEKVTDTHLGSHCCGCSEGKESSLFCLGLARPEPSELPTQQRKQAGRETELEKWRRKLTPCGWWCCWFYTARANNQVYS